MSDEPDNLVLIYLRRLDGKIDHLIPTAADGDSLSLGIPIRVLI